MHMEIVRSGDNLDGMTQEQRIKALRRGIPAYVREADADCHVVTDYYNKIIEKGYWRDLADSEEAYFLEYCKKPKAWFEAIRDQVMGIPEGTTLTVREFQQQQALSLSDTTPNPTKGRPAKIDPNEVYRLRDEGLTQKQIAEKLGCSEQQVMRILKNRHLCYHDNINVGSTSESTPSRGDSSKYLAARLARDYPEVVEQVKAGEFPSMRAAAVAAGIVKPRLQFTVGPSTTPQAFAGALFERLEPEFFDELYEALTSVSAATRKPAPATSEGMA